MPTSGAALGAALSGTDAVILAGGRGTRLGGVDKPSLTVGGRTLLASALQAGAGARRIVVVGPATLPVPEGVLRTQEDPPFGGPVAALAAGLAALDRSAGSAGPGWVLLLAADLPHASDAVAALAPVTAALDRDGDTSADGVCLRDQDGRWQWLAGVYRRAALEAALAHLPTVRDASLRRLLGTLHLVPVDGSPDTVADIDTRADLEAARSAGGADLADSERHPRPPRTEQQ
ncbi:molybdenum cofactor guanylyltransferase [Ruania halotolerans]|uniref:molybdenum cofactor guanylyltransferase n=1 Tax=Ruania halotolerans TaxID=2897773 RepID=UPI001E362BEA|nr:NTP transferase domain-containing protein [Ruania halotolerans]UFU07233.1 NTP transferase domain-containing protein [Ruania halotolerans]